MIDESVFVTGGSGTLGKALLRRIGDSGKRAVFSRDTFKHATMKQEFPHVDYIISDVRDYDALRKAMSGYDTVVHCAAQKVIPVGETDVLETIGVNIDGTRSVCEAAVDAGVKHVVFISTDKVCHAANLYGMSKAVGERICQWYAQNQQKTRFHIVRYGNVLGSTGSVVNVWRQHLEEYGKVYATDGDMTRFFLTSSDAVDLILHSLKEPSGTISIPRCPALSMKRLAEYVLPKGTDIEYTGLRPGEKRFEELITQEEAPHIEPGHFFIPLCPVMRLWPTTTEPYDDMSEGYTSKEPDNWLEREELLKMIGE